MLLSIIRSPMIIFLWLVLIAYATWAHLYFGDTDAVIALGGWSAYDFTNTILHPENFKNDYPGGAWTSGNSSLPWLYPAFASIGIPVSTTLPILIGLEIITLTIGAFFLLKTLFKNIHPVSLIAITCIFTLSYIRLCNLARFGNPYFHGHFYGYADGLRLLAIAYFLRGSHNLSSITLAIGFTIHPIKALFGFIFICGMQLWKWRTIFLSNTFFPYLLFIIFSVLWTYSWLGHGSNTIIPQISSKDFFKYSPLFNSHWFPQDLNILTDYHLKYSTALLSSMLVGLSSLIRCNLRPDIKIQLLLGILLISLTSIVGLSVAWHELSPTLVKISLQRSTVLILSLMSILALGQLFVDTKNGKWWYVYLLSFLIIYSFYHKATWPVLIALTYAISTLFDKTQIKPTTYILRVILLFLCILIIGYEYYLHTQKFQRELYWLDQLRILGALALCSIGYKLLNTKWRTYLDTYTIKYSPIIFLILFTVPSITWSINNRLLPSEYVDKGMAYKAAQLWARENTKHDSLFMVDPTINSGWRDFSQRSSFGVLHEWYNTGWLYTGNKSALNEGLVRGARLGIDKLVPERAEKRPRSEFVRNSYQQALKLFYKSDGGLIAAIAHDYDIQYIVMDKDNAKKNGDIPAWPIAYENKYYTVLVPPHVHLTE